MKLKITYNLTGIIWWQGKLCGSDGDPWCPWVIGPRKQNGPLDATWRGTIQLLYGNDRVQ